MKTKISALQLYLMLFLSRVIVSITINVQTVGGSNLIESIFSSLGLFLYLTVFSLPLFVLHKSHPEASLLQIAENNCGRGVSVPMSAIYALYFIVMNIFSLSLFLTLLVNTTDPVASRFSIVLVVLGIALYGAIRGIETISRASVCIFTLFMLGMGMIFLAVSPNVTPHYLMPLFYDGTDQTVQGFLVFTARCSSLAEFAVLMPFLTSTDTKSGKSHRVLGFVVWNGGITVFLGVLLFFIVSCLGEYAALQVFPAYTLASIAEIAGIQRLDALFIGISMMALIVRIACGLFCIAVCMTPIPTRPRAWLTALIAALTAVLSLWLTRLRRTRRGRVPHSVSAAVFRFDRRYAAEFALVFRLHQKEEETRRMKKALTSVLLSLILTLTASGCAPELYERLLISAIGVDRTATGCRVTVLASETTEDGGQSTFSGEGDTVPEALSQIALESGRTPLYSHNAAILFGMQCAESGIAEQLDFFIRHYDSRPTAKVFLAEDTAESVLLQRDLTAERFMQLSNGAKYSEAAADVNLLQLVNGLYGVNATAALPVLRADDLPTPVGTAVLQSYRLCAVLTPAETQGLSALQGTLSGGEFTVKDEAFGTVSLKVRSTNSNIIFTGTAEQPEFTARIHVIAEVSAVTNTAKHVGNEAFPRFETALANCTEERLAAYLKNANGADAAGLSEVIFRTAPNVWREMGESRAEKLSKAEITFHVTAEVQRVEEEDIPYF